MQHLLRRKIIYIILITVFSPAIASAQFRYLNLVDHDEKPFHFGITVGVNRAHYNFTRDNRFLLLDNGQVNDSVMVVESINSTGINLAWLVNMRLSNHFDLRTTPLNLVFTEKAFQYHLTYPNKPAGETAITTKKIQGITLSLPVQLKFTSDRINNLKVYMIGGGKIEYDLAAGKKKNEDIIKLKKLDYGLEAGMGFHFYFPMFVLSPELKVGFGLNNMHDRDKDIKFSNVIDKINARTITFTLTVE